MGGSASKVSDDVAFYAGLWESRDVKGSQTEIFRKLASEGSLGECDFTGAFKDYQLDNLFTSDKVQLECVGPPGSKYNCAHLARDVQGDPVIPIYSDDKFVVMHPLGEPGRDLGDGHDAKVTHLIIMKHGEGAITLNEMLPTTVEEESDLEERLGVLNLCFNHLKENSPLSVCGKKVTDKATSMGVAHSTGIRDFMVLMICNLTPEFRVSRPGYKLFDGSGSDVSGNGSLVKDLLEKAFNSNTTQPVSLIQPPRHNSQIISHIHGFLLDGGVVPDCMNDTYVSVSEILKVKRDFRAANPPLQPEPEPEPEMDVSEEEDNDDCVLSRQNTVKMT